MSGTLNGTTGDFSSNFKVSSLTLNGSSVWEFAANGTGFSLHQGGCCARLTIDGNGRFGIGANYAPLYQLDVEGDGRFTSSLTATSFIKTGGTSSQFLKADGSVDANAYATLASPTFTGTVSGITKSMVSLGNVDNTSDAAKPVSTATQSALDLKVDKVSGKGLSANDYTTTEQTKLAAITGTNTGDQDLSSYALKTYVDTANATNANLTGDVTSVGNATTIGTGKVITTMIADNAVTTAKILDGTIANADINSAAGIVDTKLATIATVGKVSNSATTATAANTASTIVARDASGNFSAGAITGTSIIKSGGTSSQFLKADGSVDPNTYLTSASGASTYLPLAGGILTGGLTGTTANFSGNSTIGNNASNTTAALKIIGYSPSGTTGGGGLELGDGGAVNLRIYRKDTNFFNISTAESLLPNLGINADDYNPAYTLDINGTLGVRTNASILGNLQVNGTSNFTDAATFAKDISVNGIKIGKGTGNNGENTAVGGDALGTGTGSRNTAVGYFALKSYSGTSFDNNTAIGYSNSVGLTTGQQNTSLGAETMMALTVGSANTAIGAQTLLNNTGSNNTALGRSAGQAVTTGNGNTFLGQGSNTTLATISNATAIGAGASVTGDNTIQLGNTAITNVKTSGTITVDAVTYPKAHGTSGQVLTTTGSGALTWTTPSTTATSYSGVLPIANGGTGSATQNFVDLTTAQTIAGAKTFSDAVTTSSSLTGGNTATSTIAGFAANINNQTGTTYILTSADNGKIITFNNAADVTLTVPSTLFAGFNCMIVQTGAGKVTITPSSVTVSNRSSYTKTAGVNAIASLIALTSTQFISSGDMN